MSSIECESIAVSSKRVSEKGSSPCLARPATETPFKGIWARSTVGEGGEIVSANTSSATAE